MSATLTVTNTVGRRVTRKLSEEHAGYLSNRLNEGANDVDDIGHDAWLAIESLTLVAADDIAAVAFSHNDTPAGWAHL